MDNQSTPLPPDESPLPLAKSETPESVTRPRMTVVGRVYHQVPGEDPTGPPTKPFYRWLDSLEQAYQRQVKIGEEWEPLDFGWVDKPALLSLSNAVKRLPSRRPTDAELAEFMDKILEVGLLDSSDRVMEFAEIPVGEEMRLSPLLIERYRIRCRSGEGKYLVYIIPG